MNRMTVLKKKTENMLLEKSTEEKYVSWDKKITYVANV